MRALLFVNPQSRRGKQRAAEVRRALRGQGIEIVAPHSRKASTPSSSAGATSTLARHMARALRLGRPGRPDSPGYLQRARPYVGDPARRRGRMPDDRRGHTRQIDVATVNGAYYVNEASVGLSSRLTRCSSRPRSSASASGRSRASALGPSATCAPFARPNRVRRRQRDLRTFQTDGGQQPSLRRLHHRAGRGDRRRPRSTLCDRGGGTAAGLGVSRAILARHGTRAAGLRVYRAPSFSVLTRRPHRITADGEPAGRTPAEFMLPQRHCGSSCPKKIRSAGLTESSY